MKTDYMHASLLIDESGSMSGLREETISSLKKFIKEQKKVKGKMTLSLWFFNTDFRMAFQGSLEDFNDKICDGYEPSGFTALLDATGRAIDETGKFLAAMKEEDRPSKVVFVTITDGRENASMEFSLESVCAKRDHQEKKYSWEFVFLGANIDAYHTGGTIGYKAQNTSNYSSTSQGTSIAYDIINAKLCCLREGKIGSMGFTPEEKAALEADVKPDLNQ